MKKLILPLVAALLLAWTSVRADPPDLSKIPEDVLVQGVDTYSMCMATVVTGVVKLRELTDAESAEPGASSRGNIRKMHEDASSLMDAVVAQAKMGSFLVNTLVKTYKHPEKEMNDKLEQLVKDTRVDVANALKDVTNYQEFQEAFTPKLEHCNDARGLWMNKVKNALKYLDSTKKKNLWETARATITGPIH